MASTARIVEDMDKHSVKKVIAWMSSDEVFEMSYSLRDADNKTEDDLVLEECIREEIAAIAPWLHDNGLDRDELDEPA